ncbi:MAG: hypothetical protein KAT04_14940 [Methylococcales bacterium]|nr:hypothetical protein [Methylococcales bacterium]
MNISPSTSALNLISSAQQKTSEAAHEIASYQVADDEVGSSDFNSTDLVKPLLSLKESELETSVAVKVLQAENERIDFFI